MDDAFIGEIRIFAGNFAPVDWAFCNGQLLPIAQYTALFSVIGTRFGGDGQTTFALPNMGGAAPMHQGAGAGLTPRAVGNLVGSQTVTLDMASIPNHTHAPQAIQAVGTTNVPTSNFWAEAPKSGFPSVQKPLYNPTPDTTMAPNALTVAGNSQPHNNLQPYLALNFIICLNGLFPSQQ